MVPCMCMAMFLCGAAGPEHPLALTGTDVSLYAPLDGTPDPLVSRGAPKPAKTGRLAYAPGVRGQAFLFRDKDGLVDYATRGVLSNRAGAIAIWVCPVGWGENDTHIRHFVTFPAGAEDKGSFCWLYKFFAGSCYFLVWEPDYGRPVLVATPMKWKSGEWVHFVATWNGCRMRLFTNGTSSGITHNLRRTLIPSVGARLRLGGRSDPDERATLLDELYVFNRELTAAEAKALYDMDKPGTAKSLPAHGRLALPTPGRSTLLDLRARLYPGMQKMVAGLDVFGLCAERRRHPPVALAVRSAAGQVVKKPVRVPARAYVQHAFDVSGLAPGGYVLDAQLLDGQRPIEEASARFTLERKAVWLGNTLGESAGVVEPWTPIEVGQQQAACWGRRVTWNNRMLPVQITSQGIDLLAAPIRITATVGGKEALLSDQSFAITKAAPDRITLTGKGRLGPLAVTLDGWMEFDGMVWLRVSVSGGAATPVDRLALEVPMRKEAATLMISGHGTSPETGTVRRVGTRMKGHVHVWVGCEKAGLSWACPQYRYWHCPDPDPRVEIVPRDQDVLLRTNWVSRRTPLGPKRLFTFALIPTPVRPKTKGWRTWGFGTQPTDNPINIYTEGWAIGHGSPIPGKKFENWYAKDLKKGKRLFYYLTMSSNSPVTDAYRTLGDEWATSALGNRPYDPKGGSRIHTGVCPGAPSLSDWLLWSFNKHISAPALPVTGIYVDVTSTPYCANHNHGCGYVDARGHTVPTLPILGVRRWQKRLYTFLRKRHPRAILMNHQSARIHLYQLGFCDTMVDGENLTMVLQSKSYPQLLPLDTWRAEYMGHPFGYVAVFLPEFTRSFAGDKKKKREYLGDERIHEVEYIAGLGITHDNLIWPAYSNPRPYVALKEAKKTFGWDDAVEFLPYWDNAKYVTLVDNADPKRIVCSLYRRPGALMAAVMNATPKPVTVTLKLHHPALGTADLASRPWVDAYVMNTFEYRDVKAGYPWRNLTFQGKRVATGQQAGVATVTVRAHNFRLLLLK